MPLGKQIERYDGSWQSVSGVVSTSSLFSCDEPVFPGKRSFSGEDLDSWVPVGGFVFRLRRVIQRKPLLTLAASQVLTSENNMPKWRSLGWQILPSFRGMLSGGKVRTHRISQWFNIVFSGTYLGNYLLAGIKLKKFRLRNPSDTLHWQEGEVEFEGHSLPWTYCLITKPCTRIESILCFKLD